MSRAKRADIPHNPLIREYREVEDFRLLVPVALTVR
jgi:hypothetical protein